MGTCFDVFVGTSGDFKFEIGGRGSGLRIGIVEYEESGGIVLFVAYEGSIRKL